MPQSLRRKKGTRMVWCGRSPRFESARNVRARSSTNGRIMKAARWRRRMDDETNALASVTTSALALHLVVDSLVTDQRMASRATNYQLPITNHQSLIPGPNAQQ